MQDEVTRLANQEAGLPVLLVQGVENAALDLRKTFLFMDTPQHPQTLHGVSADQTLHGVSADQLDTKPVKTQI